MFPGRTCWLSQRKVFRFVDCTCTWNSSILCPGSSYVFPLALLQVIFVMKFSQFDLDLHSTVCMVQYMGTNDSSGSEDLEFLSKPNFIHRLNIVCGSSIREGAVLNASVTFFTLLVCSFHRNYSKRRIFMLTFAKLWVFVCFERPSLITNATSNDSRSNSTVHGSTM